MELGFDYNNTAGHHGFQPNFVELSESSAVQIQRRRRVTLFARKRNLQFVARLWRFLLGVELSLDATDLLACQPLVEVHYVDGGPG